MKLKYEQLHDYQLFCIDFIINHPIAGIFLDMGCGKSIITLTALWMLALDYFSIGKILVIAPKRVAEDTWSREFEKWEHLYGLKISKVLGSKIQREEALRQKANIYIPLLPSLSAVTVIGHLQERGGREVMAFARFGNAVNAIR